jgi:transcriptional regulator with XRE-family HTH domain
MCMTPGEFRSWRKGLGLKQKDVADLLGLKKRVIQYYEKGRRDGKPVDIPRTVELAAYSITVGIGGFDGTNTSPLPELAGAEPRQ